MSTEAYLHYEFRNAQASHMHRHFMPKVFELCGPLSATTRVLDVGRGNGFTCGEFAKRGCQVVGVDMSQSGIELARKAFPKCRFEVASASDDLLEVFGAEPFDIVISTEVVEHLYDPRAYARTCFNALRGGAFHLHHTLPRLPQEPGDLAGRQMGFPCGSVVGLRAHQVMEPSYADPSLDGSRLHQLQVSGCRTLALPLDDHGDVG